MWRPPRHVLDISKLGLRAPTTRYLGAARAQTPSPFSCVLVRHHSSPTKPRPQSHIPTLPTHNLPDEASTNSFDGTSTHLIANNNTFQPNQPPPRSPLSHLPLPSLLRTLLVTTLTSSPTLLPLSLALTRYLTSHPRVLNWAPVAWLLRKTFYAHFCAGENRAEVGRTVDALRGVGYTGVILSYARESVVEQEAGDRAREGSAAEAEAHEQLHLWKEGTLETVRLTPRGGFIAIHFSGAGPLAMNALVHQRSTTPPPPPFSEAMHQICELARERGVRILIDAEQTHLQRGIDAWTVELMREYNKPPTRPVLVYSTYQAYLKSSPGTLAAHVRLAEREGWRLGAKVVRGAYLASEPRELVCASKEATDAQYDAMVANLMGRGGVDIVIATHNRPSVLRALGFLRSRPPGAGGEIVFAQLQGMADELSGELLLASPPPTTPASTTADLGPKVKVYKYLTWGSLDECMTFLGRRAEENRDAVGRTREGRGWVVREVGWRVRLQLGLGRWFGVRS